MATTGIAGHPERGSRVTGAGRISLFLFFVLAFLITWGLWIPAIGVKAAGGLWPFAPDQFLGQLARWSPGIAAILLSLVVAGKQGLKQLFRPLGIWHVHPAWYLLAILLQPALFFLAKSIDSLLRMSYQVASPLESITYPLVFVIPAIIVSALPGSLAEELGWRGFALPRLQAGSGPLAASLILALLWGSWHIPSLLYFGQSGAWTILLSVVSFIPVTILFTWLYNHTGGSLLLVTLLHLSQQFSNNFLGTIPTYTDDALMWLAALIIVLAGGMKKTAAPE